MSAGSSGVTLLHELMGLMRRSLTQQAAIREALYQVNLIPRGSHAHVCLQHLLTIQGIAVTCQPKIHYVH